MGGHQNFNTILYIHLYDSEKVKPFFSLLVLCVNFQINLWHTHPPSGDIKLLVGGTSVFYFII